MKETDIAYLAGLFDGEGCITISQHRDGHASMQCMVHMVGSYMPGLFKSYFGGCVGKVKKAQRHHQQAYLWCIHSNNAVGFLRIILPHLRLKVAEAELAIKYQALVNSNRSHRVSPEDRELRNQYKITMSELKYSNT